MYSLLESRKSRLSKKKMKVENLFEPLEQNFATFLFEFFVLVKIF